jgi:hypothetical protein
VFYEKGLDRMAYVYEISCALRIQAE